VKESAHPSLGSLLTLRLRVEPISVLVLTNDMVHDQTS
jgi:hypothetical protein